VRAGGQRRVPHDGLGVGVPVVRVGEDGAMIDQVTKAAFPETVGPARQQVSPEPVHGDLQDQTRRFRRGMRRREQAQQACHEHPT
jgi:hypothetical protein